MSTALVPTRPGGPTAPPRDPSPLPRPEPVPPPEPRLPDLIGTAWRWTQIGAYLAITTVVWAARKIHRGRTTRFNLYTSIVMGVVLSIGVAAAAKPAGTYTPSENYITYRKATPQEALEHLLEQAWLLDQIEHH